MSRNDPAVPNDTLTLAPPRADAPGFAGLVGQDAAVAALRRALHGRRLPHALLLGGPAGVGKATAAGILAQALNCGPSGPLDACGACVSCSKIARGLHPDVLWLAPAPRTIGIAAVRETIRAVGYTPHEGRRRVIVVDQAHALTVEAQNAFLKTLEEPPHSSAVVLVTPAAPSLLATVRSRCQSLRLSAVPLAAVREHLETVHGMGPDEARLRASLAPGSIGGALDLDLDLYSQLLSAVVDGLRLAQAGGGGVVTAADALAGLGSGETTTQRAADVLRVARGVMRDLLVVAAGNDPAGMVNADHAETWRAWGAELDVGRITAALEQLNLGLERLAGRPQPNVKMSLEITLAGVADALTPTARTAATR